MRLGINGWRIHGQRTGVGRYLLNIVRHWDREMIGDRFEEVTFYVQKPVDRSQIPLPENIQVKVLRPDAPMLVWENLRFGPSAPEEILFCPSYTRPLVAHGKCVVTTFEATLKLYPQYFPRSAWYSLPQLYLPLYQWSAHHAALVLTTTEAAKLDIIRAYGVPEEKIRVVYIAPPDVFQPLGEDARLPEIRRRYLSDDVPFFLFVGKLTPRRNVPKLMEALAVFKRRTQQPHKLMVVGLNTTGIDIAGRARELGIEKDFVYTGYVPDEDLILLYNAAHAFVLPYSYEAGASLTALEAQAAGLPVITVDTPGLRETTGNEALYMAEAEVPDMVEAMTRAAQDLELRRGLSEGGLRFARQFSWRRTAAETLAVLEEAART